MSGSNLVWVIKMPGLVVSVPLLAAVVVDGHYAGISGRRL